MEKEQKESGKDRQQKTLSRRKATLRKREHGKEHQSVQGIDSISAGRGLPVAERKAQYLIWNCKLCPGGDRLYERLLHRSEQ